MLKRKIVALEDAEDDDFIVSLWSAELHSEAADICCFSTECGHGRSSAGRAVARFSHTLAMGLSSSVVVVGPRGDERDRLVQAMARAGSAGDREGLEKAKSEAPAAVAGYALPRVGIVDGLLTNSDHEAVVSLANQFMMRSSREKKFVTVRLLASEVPTLLVLR